MANKKKKKRQSTGGKKPSYPKAAPVQSKKSSIKDKTSTTAKSTGSAGGKKSNGSDERPVQWNIVKQGTIEMNIFLFLLAVIAVTLLMQYPLMLEKGNEDYVKLKKEYPQELKEWKVKYPTDKEQDKHKNEKPLKPVKPTFQIFLLNYALSNLLMGAMTAFLGINIIRRTDLKLPIMDRVFKKDLDTSEIKDLLLNSAIWSVAALVPMTISIVIERIIGIPKDSTIFTIPVWKQCLGNLFPGLQHQLLFLLLLMSTLVWLFTRYRQKLKIEPHWAALISVVLFSALYVYGSGVTQGSATANSVVVAIFSTISIIGILGYLYWKKGLEYSLLAGIICFGVSPLIASIII